MDPTQQKSSQTVAENTQQTVQNQNNSGTAQAAPQAASGSVLKEHEPLSPVMSTSEVVQPTETEPVLPKEVIDAGVEVVKEPEITEDKQAGIQPAKESVPVATYPSGIVSLFTQVEAKDAMKKDTNNSVHWLWTLWIKTLRQLRLVQENSRST